MAYLLVSSLLLLAFAFYLLYVSPRRNPLSRIAGPPIRAGFKNQLYPVLHPSISPKAHEFFVRKYGRSIRIQGLAPWDQRLLTLDPVSVAHVLKNSTIYEKPWQSRKLITSLIGCGMLAAEGQVHKRQRRVATPAFSIQNLRALVPLVFKKGAELKDRWIDLLDPGTPSPSHHHSGRLDVCHWISRATFDVIGLAGFDYNFNAIQNETNALFNAYKDMFEIAISQESQLNTLLGIYVPFMRRLSPDKVSRTIRRCRKVIHTVAGHLIQEKKSKIQEGQEIGVPYAGRDLLSLLLKSNVAIDLPLGERVSDEDILNNINTFMFAGSDTSSLSMTWILYLLAQNTTLQDRLRSELISITPSNLKNLSELSDDEIQSLYAVISELPFLHNVVRESIRLIPPVHSSIRVATQDDVIPAGHPVHSSDGTVQKTQSIKIAKGSFVHVAIEGFNLDKEIWGEDAWAFRPERWDSLPEAAKALPGLYSNTLSFSAGPRSCIGLRFSMIEIKTFLFILLTNFAFRATEDKIFKANVVLTRPYIVGKFGDGSQCPLWVTKLPRD